MNFMIKPLELDIIKNQIAKLQVGIKYSTSKRFKANDRSNIITESLKEVEQMATLSQSFNRFHLLKILTYELVSKASKGFYFSLEEILQFRLFLKWNLML